MKDNKINEKGGFLQYHDQNGNPIPDDELKVNMIVYDHHGKKLGKITKIEGGKAFYEKIDLKYLQTFESFNNLDENKIGDFSRNIGQKMGLIKFSDEEIESKATKILQNENKILDAINKSSNPSLHLNNYKTLKNRDNKISFYKFVVYLYDNLGDLVNGRPLYYKISDFDFEDTRKQTSTSGIRL